MHISGFFFNQSLHPQNYDVTQFMKNNLFICHCFPFMKQISATSELNSEVQLNKKAFPLKNINLNTNGTLCNP